MGSKSVIIFDENDQPVLVELADVPGSGVSKTDPNARSGNPNHDTRSGKFGTTGEKADPLAPPENVDPLEWARRLDAVRDAAREMDTFEAGDIKEFLAGRSQRELSPEELDQFLADVRTQQLNDLVDIMDNQLRGIVDSLKRGRRVVRVQAPRGYTKRTFAALSDEEAQQVKVRLEARGHDAEDLARTYGERLKAAEEDNASG